MDSPTFNEAELNCQYSTLGDYEQYESRYQNPSIYVSKSPELALSRVETQCSYGTDHNSSSTIGLQPHLTTSHEENESVIQERASVSTMRYIQASQYDEMPEYSLNSCSAESHYIENPVIAYGYVSEVNFDFPIESGNTNPYSPRSLLFNNNPNGPDNAIPTDATRAFESRNDFQSKLSQLTLTPLDVTSHMSDSKHLMMDPGSDICTTLRWRDPNLSEVIRFLDNPSDGIKANAAAYLQHLCYMDDPNKQRTRSLGGIPPLIRLLSCDAAEIHKNACGALRNLSYGRQNDENKRAIKNACGITALVNLLCRTQESEVKELVTGVLWNMSSCEDIKRSIIDESLNAIVNNIMIPHSGWDAVSAGETCYSTVFRNASGVLRNVSSAGEFARTKLRDSEHLVECLIYVVKTAIEKNNIGNKTVENCVCILRNLSYRCQEVEDPNYDKQPIPVTSRAVSTCKGENLGCFGTSKKKKDITQNDQQESTFTLTTSKNSVSNCSSTKGYEFLWQPEVVQFYLALLQSCSNPETLEAAAGAIQNLSACYWQPSIDIRATVRKEKGLPILVELLRMEVDRVVCAVATALRNLAIDQRNKELIGKYAMRDLVQKLPTGNPQHDLSTSDDTITAVLATINEVIKKNLEFSRSLLDAGGVDRLLSITRQRQKYTSCVFKFASQVLLTMWQHYELRDVYKKHGWKEQDFVTKSFTAYNASPNSPNNPNNTLNRPMASQSRTRYEDRTIQRSTNNSTRNNDSNEFVSCNEPPLVCQLVDDSSTNDVDNETFKRETQHSQAAVYLPIVESGRNNSN